MRIGNQGIASALFRLTQTNTSTSLLKTTLPVDNKKTLEPKMDVLSKKTANELPLFLKTTADNGIKTKIIAGEARKEIAVEKNEEKATPLSLGYVKLIEGGKTLSEKLSKFRGTGDSTTEIQVREDLATKENWLMSLCEGAKAIKEMPSMSWDGVFSNGSDGEQVQGYGLRARYDQSSTGDTPVMMVETFDEAGGKKSYLVNLSQVDASNATMIEGFALVAHSYAGSDSDGKMSSRTGTEAMRSIIQKHLLYTGSVEYETYSGEGYTVTSPVSGTPPAIVADKNRLGFQDRFDFLIGLEGEQPGANKDVAFDRFAHLFNPESGSITPEPEEFGMSQSQSVSKNAKETRHEKVTSAPTGETLLLTKQTTQRNIVIDTLKYLDELSRKKQQEERGERNVAHLLSPYFYL